MGGDGGDGTLFRELRCDPPERPGEATRAGADFPLRESDRHGGMRAFVAIVLPGFLFLAGCSSPDAQLVVAQEPAPAEHKPIGFEPLCPSESTAPTLICALYLPLETGYVVDVGAITEDPLRPGNWFIGGDVGTPAGLRQPTADAILDYPRATVFWLDSEGSPRQTMAPYHDAAAVPATAQAWASIEYIQGIATDPQGSPLALTLATGGGTNQLESRAIFSSLDANGTWHMVDEHPEITINGGFAVDGTGRWLLSPCVERCRDDGTQYARKQDGTWLSLDLPAGVGPCEGTAPVSHGDRLGLACLRSVSDDWGDAITFLEITSDGFTARTPITDARCAEIVGSAVSDGSVGLIGTRCNLTDGPGYDYWFARVAPNWTAWQVFEPLQEQALGGDATNVDVLAAAMDVGGVFHLVYTVAADFMDNPTWVGPYKMWYVAWDPIQRVELARLLLDEGDAPAYAWLTGLEPMGEPAIAVMGDGTVTIAWGRGEGLAVATLVPMLEADSPQGH